MLLLFSNGLGAEQAVGRAVGTAIDPGIAASTADGSGSAQGSGSANGTGATTVAAASYQSKITVHAFLPLPWDLPVPDPELCTTQKNAAIIFKMLVMDQAGTPIDLSAAVPPLSLIFQRPSQAKITKVAAFTTDGSDGFLQYAFAQNEIDDVGTWHVQLAIAFPPGGFAGLSDVIRAFIVADNIA